MKLEKNNFECWQNAYEKIQNSNDTVIEGVKCHSFAIGRIRSVMREKTISADASTPYTFLKWAEISLVVMPQAIHRIACVLMENTGSSMFEILV